MTHTPRLVWYGLLLLAIGELGALAQSLPIRFSVRHQHRFGHCDGLLRLDENAIAYETGHREHGYRWPFPDIRHLEIFSPTRLILSTYGRPEKFDFRLREAELTADAYRLLAEKVERGLTSRVLFTERQFRFALPARHKHRRGGCQGTVRIGAAEIVYETEHPEDRRLWRMRDIRSFGTAGPYDLRLTTERETFTFDLKERLPQEAYDHLWGVVYQK